MRIPIPNYVAIHTVVWTVPPVSGCPHRWTVERDEITTIACDRCGARCTGESKD